MLKSLGHILAPAKTISNMLIRGSIILDTEDDPDAFLSPCNSIAVYANLDIVRRCFGDDVLRKAFMYRREFAADYRDTNHYLEKVHMVDITSDAYDVGAQCQQLFLAYQREQFYPFFEEDILRATFSMNPDTRYIKGMRSKYLLKDILEQRTGSPVARKPKGFSVFEQDLIEWMRVGPLRPMVEDIHLPGFLSRVDFTRLLEKPDYFLWELLVYDIYQRRCLI